MVQAIIKYTIENKHIKKQSYKTGRVKLIYPTRLVNYWL